MVLRPESRHEFPYRKSLYAERYYWNSPSRGGERGPAAASGSVEGFHILSSENTAARGREEQCESQLVCACRSRRWHFTARPLVFTRTPCTGAARLSWKTTRCA